MRKNKLVKTGVLTLGLIFAGSNMAFATDTVTDMGDSTNVNVQAKVESNTGTVYKVDIEWGSMQFSYNNEANWNPDTHEVGGNSGWTVTDAYYGENNTLTVTNHSNAEVKVDYDYTKDPAVTSFINVEGNLFETQAAAKKSATEGSTDKKITEYVLPSAVGTSAHSAPSKSVYFSLTGAPENPKASDFSKVGAIQLTISEVSSSESTVSDTPEDSGVTVDLDTSEDSEANLGEE